jgi:hypothetical protein
MILGRSFSLFGKVNLETEYGSGRGGSPEINPFHGPGYQGSIGKVPGCGNPGEFVHPRKHGTPEKVAVVIQVFLTYNGKILHNKTLFPVINHRIKDKTIPASGEKSHF